jgi:hypothetical protein
MELSISGSASVAIAEITHEIFLHPEKRIARNRGRLTGGTIYHKQHEPAMSFCILKCWIFSILKSRNVNAVQTLIGPFKKSCMDYVMPVELDSIRWRDGA